MIRSSVVLAIIGLLSAVSAPAATITWTNAVGGAWSDPANWDSGTVPGPSDDAVITLSGNYTVTFDTNVAVDNLTAGGASGTQNFNWAASDLSVANFTINSNASFDLPPGATLNLGGTINSWGTINWDTTNALGGLTNCTINNYGTFNLQTNFNTGGFRSIYYSGAINPPFFGAFNSSGTVLVQSNLGTVVFFPNMMYFTNSGTITIGTNSTLALTGSAYSGAAWMSFNNNTLITGPGLLQDVDGYIIASGDIVVNSTFELDGGYTQYPYEGTTGVIQGSQTWSGSGSLNINGGVIGNIYDVGVLSRTASNITTFATNFQVNVLQGGLIINSQIINNEGTITWGPISSFLEIIANESYFTNSGMMVFQGNLYMTAEGGFPGVIPISIFNNTGTILTSAGNNLLQIEGGWAFTNSGVIEVITNASLDLESGITNGITLGPGTVINAAGQVGFAASTMFSQPSYLVANGTITINGPPNPNGNLLLGQGYVSGTQTWTGSGSLGLSNTTFYGSGTTTIATNFQAVGPGDNYLTLDGHAMNNRGTITGDVLNFTDNGHMATFINNGTIVLSNFLGFGPLGQFPYTNYGSSFVNSGLIEVYPRNSRQLQSLWNVTNNGTIDVVGPYFEIDAANLVINDGSVFSGLGQIALNYSPTTLYTPGTITANGNITVNNPTLSMGSLTVLQGTQTWGGAGSLIWSSGAVVQPGTTTIAPNFTLYLTNDPADYSPWLSPNLYIRTLAQDHVLNNQGTVIWNTTNAVLLTNQAAFVNSGLVLLETNCALQQTTSDCGFNNQSGGVVRNLGGPSVFNCPFTNSGTLDLESGTLSVGNPYTLAASSVSQFTVGGAATALTVPALNPNGVLAVSLPNGYTPMDGTAFTLVNYNSFGGMFANTQLPPLPPTLQWKLSYGPNSLVLEAVTTPTQIAGPIVLPDGTFQFSLTGPPGNGYAIQASTNFVNWITLQTNNSFSGQINFTDSEATNFGYRFYRAIVGN